MSWWRKEEDRTSAVADRLERVADHLETVTNELRERLQDLQPKDEGGGSLDAGER